MSTNRPHDSQQPRPSRIAVIGGGISGLAAANRLIELSRERGRPIELELFHDGTIFGGAIFTHSINGYLAETGADSFITNKPWAVDLCRRLGLADQLIETDSTFRRSLVLRKGRPVVVPEGFTLLSPAMVWPVICSPIFSPWGKLRMGMDYFLPRKRDNGDESLASFVRRRFGQEALERLVQPLVGGIYTSDPEKLSLQATMPRFLEMEQACGSLIRASRRGGAGQTEQQRGDSGARYSLFLSLAGGLSQLVDALVARILEHHQIFCQTTISEIVPVAAEGDSSTSEQSGRWKLTTRNTPPKAVDAVIVAVPAGRAARLVENFDAQWADALSQIEYASTAVVVTGHKLSDIAHPLDAFGLVVPAVERRDILAVSFASRKFRGRAPEGCAILRTFLGGAMQPELMAKSDEELLEIARRELAEILGVRGRHEFSIVCRYNNAMPQYHVGHLDRVAKIEQVAAAHAGLFLAGNACHGVGIPDCIHSGELAAERLFEKL